MKPVLLLSLIFLLPWLTANFAVGQEPNYYWVQPQAVQRPMAAPSRYARAKTEFQSILADAKHRGAILLLSVGQTPKTEQESLNLCQQQRWFFQALPSKFVVCERGQCRTLADGVWFYRSDGVRWQPSGDPRIQRPQTFLSPPRLQFQSSVPR